MRTHRAPEPLPHIPLSPGAGGLGTHSPIHTRPKRGVALGACVSDKLSSAGWMRRGVRDAEVRGRRQGGRHGGPGFGWVPDLLLFFFFLMSHPQVSPRWVGAAGSTYGPLRKGQVWVGPAGKAASSCACPLFPSWALGWGRPKGPARGWPFELGSGGRSEQSS